MTVKRERYNNWGQVSKLVKKKIYNSYMTRSVKVKLVYLLFQSTYLQNQVLPAVRKAYLMQYRYSMDTQCTCSIDIITT